MRTPVFAWRCRKGGGGTQAAPAFSPSPPPGAERAGVRWGCLFVSFRRRALVILISPDGGRESLFFSLNGGRSKHASARVPRDAHLPTRRSARHAVACSGLLRSPAHSPSPPLGGGEGRDEEGVLPTRVVLFRARDLSGSRDPRVRARDPAGAGDSAPWCGGRRRGGAPASPHAKPNPTDHDGRSVRAFFRRAAAGQAARGRRQGHRRHSGVRRGQVAPAGTVSSAPAERRTPAVSDNGHLIPDDPA